MSDGRFDRPSTARRSTTMYDEAPIRVRGGSLILQITGGEPANGKYLEWKQEDNDGFTWSVARTAPYSYVVDEERGPHNVRRRPKPRADVQYGDERLTFTYHKENQTTTVTSSIALQQNPHDLRSLYATVTGRFAAESEDYDPPQLGE
jgi:hypothetical protein